MKRSRSHFFRRTPAMPAALILVCIQGACAQEDMARLKDLPFIGHGSNRIELRGDSTDWKGLHAKLDRLQFQGEGRIDILHIGGSHVQADMWSMQMRHRAQTMAPGLRGARGFIFPYAMAKSNNPYWYEPVFTGAWTAVRNVNRADSSSLGLAGISVTTRDSVADLRVSFRGEVYPGYTFNRATVLHRMDSSMTVAAWTRDSTVRITTTTDTAAWTTTFHFDRYLDTLNLRFTRTDSAHALFTLHGLVLDSDDPGMVLHASGVNGASTTSWLRCQRFTQDMRLITPDLAILSIGINDAHDPDFDADRFKRNYRELITRIKEASPDAAILLTTNTDSYMKRKVPNRNAEVVRRVMQELSTETGAGVWDALGVMGGVGAIKQWEAVGLAKRDRIHMTREGYALLGDLLMDAWMDLYDAHLKRLAHR